MLIHRGPVRLFHETTRLVELELEIERDAECAQNYRVYCWRATVLFTPLPVFDRVIAARDGERRDITGGGAEIVKTIA